MWPLELDLNSRALSLEGSVDVVISMCKFGGASARYGCGDGSECDTEGCCLALGGLAHCPPDAPRMCEDKTCSSASMQMDVESWFLQTHFAFPGGSALV